MQWGRQGQNCDYALGPDMDVALQPETKEWVLRKELETQADSGLTPPTLTHPNSSALAFCPADPLLLFLPS